MYMFIQKDEWAKQMKIKRLECRIDWFETDASVCDSVAIYATLEWTSCDWFTGHTIRCLPTFPTISDKFEYHYLNY